MQSSVTASKITRLVAAAAAIAGAACADVSVRRIDDRGRASGPDGLRFYMPRPYVAVHEPFVVASEAYLVSGALSLDGTHVLITGADDDLAGHFKALAGTPAIHASRVHAPAPAGAPDAPALDRATASPIGADAPGPVSSAQAPADAPSGRFDLEITNDNDAFAVTPFKRYFDIYWLPDFDEQYVVSPEAGLANADTLLNLGQGWSFQGLNTSIDNSAITERLLALYDASIEMLTRAARSALFGPAGLLPAPAPPAISAQSAFEAGEALSLRVTVCRVVAPGIYPILKPDEIERFSLGGFQSLATHPEAGPIRERLLIPIPPMTNVAFNTYEVIVVEGARADGGGALGPLSLAR